MLDHGFARIRCDACTHEYLLAFSCKYRYFCPSCHAKGLAIWTQWLDATLLAPVPHRQVVLTIPKRLRAYCLYRHRLLGEIALVAWIVTLRAGGRGAARLRRVRVGAWIAVGYCAIGFMANAATPSAWERVLWLPVVAGMHLTSYVVARAPFPSDKASTGAF